MNAQKMFWISRIADIFLFFGLSIWEFMYLELFFDKNFNEFPLDIIVKNVLLIMTFNLALLSLIRSFKTTFAISCALALIIGAANYFVISFRGYGIVFMDFYAIKTAANVAGRYSYAVDKNFILGTAAALAGIFASLLAPKKVKADKEESNKKIRRYAAFFESAAGILTSIFFLLWINYDATFFRGVKSITWDHSIGMNDYGYLLYFAANAGKAKVDEPDGYSAQKADEILSRYELDAKDGEREKKQASDNKKNPNVIMIMNESFSDLRVLGDLSASENVLDFYDSLDENTIKGYVQSSVYGGYTANSEFEFLTGSTKAFLPGNPYLQYMDDYLPSIISVIKSQKGYGEAVALHPYNPSGYNRNTVYPLLYFDRFISIDDFKDPITYRGYISDMSDYRKIEELYEEKDENSSLCVFNVTMQNHNPYDYTGNDFKNDVKAYEYYSLQLNQYLSLMKKSDEALEQLIKYFENANEPVIVLLFGDHQPHLPDSFYQKIKGKNPLQFTQKDTMEKYMTPFLIWANYDIPEMDIGRTSINFLSSIFLKAAGLKMSDYNRYLLDLYKKLPAISAVGIFDERGILHDPSKNLGKYADLMNEYEIVQYNYLFDKKNRLDRHYSIN